MPALRRLFVALTALALGFVVVPFAQGGPSDFYARPHFGNGKLPAECIVDRDPINPDNRCYHLKVGLNALDTPKVDVAVLIPVSPGAERDQRVMTQAVQMWDDGLHYLAKQMDLDWLAEGLEMDIHTKLVPVDKLGLPTEPVDLIDPEIVVVATNPVGGIGIGVDPSNLASEGFTFYDGEGVPCVEVEDPFSMDAWQARDGFQQHGGEPGGIYVEDCGGAGGNVCFAVNGAVDPIPGMSDFFPLYELVAHEFGHCLTLGHVGDGAEGAWGMTATNDIMAYSTDPPLFNKCVSTLDVEGFALRMSKYLDVNGDGKVDDRDKLVPNDLEGDGLNSFQVQHPKDHLYASPTGDPADCPQPNQSLTPGAETDFMPKAVATTKPDLKLGKVIKKKKSKRVRISGVAQRLPLAKQPTAYSASAADASGDAKSPLTDLKDVRVNVTPTTVDAVLKVGQIAPTTPGNATVAYSLTIDGRRLDSFIPNGSTNGKPVVMDNGTGYFMPDGTATWDTTNNTVTFKVRRDYLADQAITAPYNVYGVTGVHARSNDWVTTDDLAPNARDLDVAAPTMGPETRDAPVAKTVKTETFKGGSDSFHPGDTTLGIGLISAVQTRDFHQVPIPEQSSVLATLTWEGDAALGLYVNGGSGQKRITTESNKLQVLVPWARRDLTVTVDPEIILTPTDYTLTIERTTVIADRDGDQVPDVADNCADVKGPRTGHGCPDTDKDTVYDRDDRCPRDAGLSADGCPTADDETVVAFLDGKRIDTTTIFTQHGAYAFDFKGKLKKAKNKKAKKKHTLVVKWYDDGQLVAQAVKKFRH